MAHLHTCCWLIGRHKGRQTANILTWDFPQKNNTKWEEAKWMGRQIVRVSAWCGKRLKCEEAAKQFLSTGPQRVSYLINPQHIFNLVRGKELKDVCLFLTYPPHTHTHTQTRHPLKQSPRAAPAHADGRQAGRRWRLSQHRSRNAAPDRRSSLRAAEPMCSQLAPSDK